MDKVRRIGILANEPWPPLDGLRDGLRGLGYIEPPARFPQSPEVARIER
jgi:hypothetical protein